MFDPYYKWLGIRPEHQPPDHYRLLGLDPFESDSDVIRTAAERQMAHVQSYKIGPQSDLSQRLLNEIGRAKFCLLNPETKAEYDRTLRQRMQPAAAAESPPVIVDEAAPAVRVNAAPRAPVKHRRRNGLGVAISIGSILIVVSAVGGAFLITPKEPVDVSDEVAPPAVVAPLPKPAEPAQRREFQRSGKPRPATSPMRRANGKLPVPTAEQRQQARAEIHIEGRLEGDAGPRVVARKGTRRRAPLDAFRAV